MRARPQEIKALVPLLEQDWETPEELAKALIETLDDVRAARTTYIGVMQFGEGPAWYAATGPWPGSRSAAKALQSDPAASLAHRAVVVPLLSPDGLKRRIEETDRPAKKGA